MDSNVAVALIGTLSFVITGGSHTSIELTVSEFLPRESDSMDFEMWNGTWECVF